MATSARVLVVDDEQDQRALLRRTLERIGCLVEEADDGEGALASIADDTPDIIVLDLKMARVGGLEFLRRRAEEKLAPRAVVIVCSGASSDEVPPQCFSFSKPIHQASFHTLVRELVVRRQQSS